MSVRRLVACALLLAIGYAMAAGLYWTLLNVPESTVLALLASAGLALALVVCAGVTTAAALELAQGARLADALASGVRALPLFILSLLLFGMLWALVGFSYDWWAAHRGEVDALSLRYLRTDRTGPLHVAVEWFLWLVQWGLGLSLVGGLTAAGALQRARASALTGLRTATAALPLASVIAGVLIFTEGLWRFAYWRPATLATTSEMFFVSLKLATLYVATIVLVTVSLAIVGRTIRRLATSVT